MNSIKPCETKIGICLAKKARDLFDEFCVRDNSNCTWYNREEQTETCWAFPEHEKWLDIAKEINLKELLYKLDNFYSGL